MTRNNARSAILLGILATLLSSSSCTTKTVQTAPNFLVPVTVAKAEVKTVPIDLTAIGSAEAYSNVSVKSQVNAVLEEVHIKEGQFVKKGDLLFTLDARPFEAALAQAQAALARDKAQAELDGVQAARYGELYKAGVAPKEQYDQMEANADAQRAAVRADEAAVQSAQLQLDYCKIYAPIDGRTGALQVYPGNIVKQNDVPILIVINQISPMFVDFSIPEQYLTAVEKFMAKGQLRVEATPYGETKPESGTLTFVDNSVDNTTGTIKLKAQFENSDHRLWPGQFSTVLLRLAQDEDATVVPSQAVQTGTRDEFIYVLKADSTVEQRTVKVARTVGGDAVIASGIQPGETVVTDGQLRLIPGMRVQVVKSPTGS
ncbi:MAG TPA: efflux RND transporter periplasmic adaptor subunit [Candidatus Acidoferrales bacterium]|nr:efflux RND transporter periplasmic adaptor subunit [Candidatus Acidoferrales bacterium]